MNQQYVKGGSGGSSILFDLPEIPLMTLWWPRERLHKHRLRILNRELLLGDPLTQCQFPEPDKLEASHQGGVPPPIEEGGPGGHQQRHVLIDWQHLRELHHLVEIRLRNSLFNGEGLELVELRRFELQREEEEREEKRRIFMAGIGKREEIFPLSPAEL